MSEPPPEERAEFKRSEARSLYVMAGTMAGMVQPEEAGKRRGLVRVLDDYADRAHDNQSCRTLVPEDVLRDAASVIDALPSDRAAIEAAAVTAERARIRTAVVEWFGPHRCGPEWRTRHAPECREEDRLGILAIIDGETP